MVQEKEGHKEKAMGLIPAQPHDIAGLVAYAEGSVVSRTLFDNDRGTVTLFAFDAGQNLSEHTAPYDAYVQVLDGQAELIIGGKAVSTKAGQLTIMPANVPHAVKAVGPFKMMLIMIRA